MTMTMTPANRLLAADDALAACPHDLRSELRNRALSLAAAWHDVNGTTLRADEADALTRAQADLAAERKAWQSATQSMTPDEFRAEVAAIRTVLGADSFEGVKDAARRSSSVAKEATARAETAEREVARLTGAGAARLTARDLRSISECLRGGNDDERMAEADRMDGIAAGMEATDDSLAHGRAASPPPDASDEEIARALYAATAVPGAYDDLPWSVIEPQQRAGWIAAVTTVIRPRLDALRAEVDRLTTDLAAAEEACRLHERERDVAQAELARVKEARLNGILEPFEDIARELHNDAGDLHERGKGSDHAVAVAMNEAASKIKAAVQATAEAHAVVDTGATPPAALPQVEAFELPAVKWTRDEYNDTDPDDETSHTAWRTGDGIRSEYASTWFEARAVGWSLLLDGTAPDEPTARARVEAAVAVLAGRAEVRR